MKPQLAATLALVVLAAGAACCKPEIVYQRVDVPIAVPCPEPPVLAWPDLPIYHLEAVDPPTKVVKAYATSIEILQGQLWQAFRMLDGYRTSTPAAAPRKQP